MEQENSVAFSDAEGTGSGSFPPVQVFEDEAAVYVRAFTPGVSPETFSVEYAAGTLILMGSIPPPGGLQYRRDRPSGPFRRELKLPCSVAGENIRAVMRNGILSIVLPKRADPVKRSILVTFLQDITQ